jgi:hypothetical protein
MPTAREITIKELAERRPGQGFEPPAKVSESATLWPRSWSVVTRVVLRK